MRNIGGRPNLYGRDHTPLPPTPGASMDGLEWPAGHEEQARLRVLHKARLALGAATDKKAS